VSDLPYKVKTQPKSYDQAFKDKIDRDIVDLREMFKHDIESISIDVDSINKDLYQLNRNKISEIVGSVKRSDVRPYEVRPYEIRPYDDIPYDTRNRTKSLKRASVENLLHKDIVMDQHNRGISAHNDYRIRDYKELEPKSMLAKAGHRVVFSGVNEIVEQHGHPELGSGVGSRSRSGLKSNDRNRHLVSERNRPRSSDSRTFKTSSLANKSRNDDRKRYSPDMERGRGSSVYRELYNGYSLAIQNGSQLRPIMECPHCADDNDQMCNCREYRYQKYRSKSPYISTSAPLVSRNIVKSVLTTSSDPQNPQNPFTSNPTEEFITEKTDKSNKSNVSFMKQHPKDFLSDEAEDFSLSGY
jgi:hypothetical protein